MFCEGAQKFFRGTLCTVGSLSSVSSDSKAGTDDTRRLFTFVVNKRFHVNGGGGDDVVMCKFIFTRNAMNEDVPTVRFRKDKQAFHGLVENRDYVKWVNWYVKDTNGNDSNSIRPEYVESYARIVQLVKDFWNRTMQPEEVDIWDY